MSILTLENVGTMMKETIVEYRTRHPVFSPNDDARDKALLQRLNTPLTGWEQVAAFNELYSPNYHSLLGSMARTTCYKPSCFQFNQGDAGWYFTYVNFGNSTMTLALFRLPVVSPLVSRSHGLGMDETCVYLITGFFNDKKGSYVPLQMYVPANPPSSSDDGYCYYKCLGNSDMKLEATGPDGTRITWSGNTSLSKMTLNIKLSVISADLMFESDSSKVWNGEGGCVPACVAGTGSLYWSYTAMNVKGTVQGTAVEGIGWFDHQWKNSQRPGQWLLRLADNLSHISSPPMPLKWNWLTIQLPEKQYMIWISYSKNPKKGNVYRAMIANKYMGSLRTSVSATAVIEETSAVEGISFPTRIKIQVEGETFTLVNRYTTPNIVRVGSQLNWEGIADIEERPDGQGFLESNSFQDGNTIMARTASQAGIVDVRPFLYRTLTFREYAPSLFMVIFLLVILLFVVIGIPMLAVHCHRSKVVQSASSHTLDNSHNIK